MDSNNKFPLYRSLFLSLRQTPDPAALRSFVSAQEQSGISVKWAGNAPPNQTEEERLRIFFHYCSAKPRCAMLVSNNSQVLLQAREQHMAAVGFQPPGSPFLTGTDYVFQEFTPDLADYLKKAFCRFHRLPVLIAATGRLAIRETCMEDLPWLSHLYQAVPDDTVRFFPPSLPISERRGFLYAYIKNMYGLYDLGMYTILSVRTGEPVGHCGFSLPGTDPCLGYLIDPVFRRQGYALEACRACLDYLWDTTDYSRVLCRFRPDNLASQRLAECLGFRPEKPQTETAAETGDICLTCFLSRPA